MSNRLSIVRMKFTEIATGEEDYGLLVFDAYGDAIVTGFRSAEELQEAINKVGGVEQFIRKHCTKDFVDEIIEKKLTTGYLYDGKWISKSET